MRHTAIPAQVTISTVNKLRIVQQSVLVDVLTLLVDAIKQVAVEFDQQKDNLMMESIVRDCDQWSNSLAGGTYTEVTLTETKAVFAAMEAEFGTGPGPGSYGSHFYYCPNAYMYTIGECGGAMVESTCPECGATIGGTSHNLAAGNTAATHFLSHVQRT